MGLVSLRPLQALVFYQAVAFVTLLMPLGAQANDILSPNVVAHQFVGEVTFWSNTQPFGFDLALGDPVEISVQYNKTVVGTKVTFTEFPQTLQDGIALTLGGKTLRSSDYQVKLLDGNGGTDIHNFESENGILDNVSPRDLRFGLNFQDNTGSLFDNEDALLDSLLPLSKFTTTSGFIQNTGTNGLINFEITGVPEPSSLATLVLGGIVLSRRRQ